MLYIVMIPRKEKGEEGRVGYNLVNISLLGCFSSTIADGKMNALALFHRQISLKLMMKESEDEECGKHLS